LTTILESAPLAATNPFAAQSPLPLHYPPFDRIRDSDFRPAFEAGMAEQRDEIDAIAQNPADPTFDNTIVAIERSGRLLHRVRTVFFQLNDAHTSPERQQIQIELSPKLSAHRDAIHLDPALFARVRSLYERRASLGLDGESAQLLARTHTLFVRAGARLSDSDKATLQRINETLSTLMTRFEQNVLKGRRAAAVEVDDVRQLEGLSDSHIAAAAQAATARGLAGRWLIVLQNTTTQPVMSQLKDRALRERIHAASIARNIGGEFDNTAIVADLVRLRAQRAKLLGYANHAAYVLDDETAGTTAAVDRMLGDLAIPAMANAEREAAEIQALIDRQAAAADTEPFALAAWDWAFYAEQVRAERYAYDDAQVRPYFEIDHVLRDGVFHAARMLYGIEMRERFDLPVYAPDVRVFDVIDRDGSLLGLFIADLYARDSKSGGAWMNAYVTQSGLFGQKPVIANHQNIAKPMPGQPTLLTFTEVVTMFHEFGHGLHGLFSNVRYPSLAGTAVPRDFVEYPSQFNEMWARDPQVLANYARHHETGEPLPEALREKVLAATTFGQGYATTEYLASATLDQRWHQLAAGTTPDAGNVVAFEEDVLAKAGFRGAPVPPRYRSDYFSHVFAGGYSAGYYAYLWSEVLALDSEQWIKDHGGLRRENGERIRATVLSRGRSTDVLSLFRDLHGRDPEIAPLLAHRGLQHDTAAG
jgi:peptidyl-dipeptidase Dcp